MAVALGQVLAGKYRVDRVLGEGGMGVVVAATHVALDQKVALKFMLPHAAAKHDLAARFIREARAAVRLRSEHVGRVLDVGSFEDGAPYIVMEFLDGIDLGEYVRRCGPVSIPIACDYVLQACVAVAEAHSHGIVHRDLKPANLFLTRGADGSALVKVLDFGISKVDRPDGGGLSLTQTGVIMGSPNYMSPEQLRSTKDADTRSDIWSLGVILYELVSGRLPFAAESFSAVCLNVALSPPAPLGLLGNTGSGLEAVIKRCLDKEPVSRYPTVAALARALAPFAPAHARRTAERVSQILRMRVDAVPDSGTSPRRSRSSSPSTFSGSSGEITPTRSADSRQARGWVLAGAIAVSVVGGAVALIALHDGDREVAPPAPEQPSVAAAPVPPSLPPTVVPDAAPPRAADPPAQTDAGAPAAAAAPPPSTEPKGGHPRTTRTRTDAKKPAPPPPPLRKDPLGSAD